VIEKATEPTMKDRLFDTMTDLIQQELKAYEVI